jgi:predicted Holliday junction resolvase-like endonuclease
MDTQQIIKDLKNSDLYAECPCGAEFKLSDLILFDGTKPFPPEVLEIQKQYDEELLKRAAKLKKNKKLTTEKATITTRSVNIGKNLEKVLPIMEDFKWQLPDCRFLGDPIDLLTFNGLSVNKIESISFIEVKSGKARLNKHQKLVKEAVEDNRVRYKVF